ALFFKYLPFLEMIKRRCLNFLAVARRAVQILSKQAPGSCKEGIDLESFSSEGPHQSWLSLRRVDQGHGIHRISVVRVSVDCPGGLCLGQQSITSLHTDPGKQRMGTRRRSILAGMLRQQAIQPIFGGGIVTLEQARFSLTEERLGAIRVEPGGLIEVL